MRNNRVFKISANSERDEDEEGKVDETSTEIKSVENDASYWNLLHIGTIMSISVIPLTVVMLIPRHNSIIYPSYWFELPILALYISIFTAFYLMTIIYLLTNQKEILKIAIFLKLYLVFAILNGFTYTVAYFLWVIVIGKNHPIPFLGLIAFFAGAFSVFTGIFLAIPSDLVNNIDFNGRLKSSKKYVLYWFFIHLQKDALSIIFEKLPPNFKFVIAFIIPIFREGNKRILSKFVQSMAGKEDERAHVWMSVSVNIHYALFITIRMAGTGNITVFSIMTIDFLFHLIFTYDIIKTYRTLIRQSPDEDENERNKDKKQQIMKLILAETVEGIVPMCYAVGLIMAYYGPNSMLLGNVGSGIWAYHQIEDVGRHLKVMFGMFCMDVLSVLLNSVCLSKYGNVNLVQDFLKFLRKYWLLLGINLGHDLLFYFGFNDINHAMDMTTEFSWITDEGRMKFINGSTELTKDEKESLLSYFD